LTLLLHPVIIDSIQMQSFLYIIKGQKGAIMKKRFLIMVLLLTAFNGMLIYADVKKGEIKEPAFLKPERIDPYAMNHNMGSTSPPHEYFASANYYYTQEHYSRAAKSYHTQLKGNPYSKNISYNLSRCYGRLEIPELAARYLVLAYNNGFTNLKHVMKDKSFDPVRDKQPFSSTMDSLQVAKANRPRIRF
jgi:hypothetical protein